MFSAWTAALAVRTARLFAAAAGNAAVQNLVQKSCVSAEHRIGKPVLYPAELLVRMSSQ